MFPDHGSCDTAPDWFTRGLAAHREERLDDAFFAYEQALRCYDSHFPTLHHLGILAHQTGNHAQALEFFGVALASDPGSAAVYTDLGTVFGVLGEYAAALHSYEQALALDAGAAAALCGRGAVLQRLQRHADALADYDAALALSEADADAWTGRARALHGLGRLQEAIASAERALGLGGGASGAFEARAAAETLLGRHGAAVESYRKAVQAVPDDAVAWRGLCQCLGRLGRFDEALPAHDALIALQPDDAAAHRGLGDVLRALKRNAEAVDSYQQAVILQPGDAQARLGLGYALHELGRAHGALTCFDAAVERTSSNPAAHNGRGLALQALKRHDEALLSLDRALACDPGYLDAMLNRGNVLQDLGRVGEALACYDTVLALRGDAAPIWNNRGNALEAAQRDDEALACYAQAIALDPDYAVAYWNRALLDLQYGRLLRGWEGYEWRWKTEHLTVYRQKRDFAQPLWLGTEDLCDKSILLHAEQGLGDTLQFCRYVPLVAARGARVILEVQRPLVGLLESLGGTVQILAKGDPLPEFDFQCPLMSLPLAFGTEVDTIPAPQRYLAPDAARLAAWQERLGPKTRPRVGLVWSGNMQHANDHNRSIPFAQLAPLLALDCEFYSLQKEYRAADLAALDASVVRRMDAHLNDFADTAALAEQMDLVIAVDTSVAHLSASLGRPVWVMLPHVADWRWLTGREDSPWYPGVRLLRQPKRGDWEGAIANAAAQLASL